MQVGKLCDVLPRQMQETAPLVPGERNGSDAVVQATLHRCAHSIQTGLDSEQIASRLEEEGILPAAAVPFVHALQPPDNPARRAVNIRLLMGGVNRAQFERFIDIVKEYGQVSRPLEELGRQLESEYSRLKNNPAEAEREARRYLEDMPRSSCDTMWRVCYCKVFLPLTILYLTVLVVSGLTVYFTLWTTPPALQPINPLPTLISGTTIAEIKLGGNVSMVTVSVNCSGQILIGYDFHCSHVAQVSSGWQDLRSPMQHLLAGSLLHIYYYDANLPHNYAIIQSLETYRQKCSCTTNVNDFCFSSPTSSDHQDAQNPECTRECQRDKLCPSSLASSGSLNDIMCLSNTSFLYTVSANDFYYLEFGASCPDTKSVNILSYNISQMMTSGNVRNYTLSRNDQSGPYSATFKLPGKDFNGCVLLDAQCPSDQAAYDVTYDATPSPVAAHNFTCFLAWGLIAAVGVVLATAQGVTFWWKFFGRRKKLHSDHSIN